tara:strand:- start:2691 stop:3191 length:501 start_codon:yes stop_codon:yes gene_type:complete
MSNNISLRKPISSDLKQLLLWENDFQNKLYTDRPIFYSVDEIQNFLSSDHDLLSKGQLRYIIVANEIPVGCIDLYSYDLVNSRAGVGIFIDLKFRLTGYASKSLEMLKTIANQEYFISNLYAEIMANNIASIRLFEKSGFIKNGKKQNWIRKEDSFEDLYFYQILL